MASRAAYRVMNTDTVQARVEDGICFLTLHRPEASNAINRQMIDDCQRVVEDCEGRVTILVLQGLPDVFSIGADFAGLNQDVAATGEPDDDPARLYHLWLGLANAPFVTIAHVRGRANAGGVGFATACDVVLASDDAQFSLSELLFGLFPACVMPFLIRRVGLQRAHYLTLMTRPIDVKQALAWGLVDASGENSDRLLHVHLRRLKYVSGAAIAEYKAYMATFNRLLSESYAPAVQANRKMFSNPETLDGIRRYVATGRFPWDR
jgi:polyketide biosynthesis enoyl-CoA hydratase PksH